MQSQSPGATERLDQISAEINDLKAQLLELEDTSVAKTAEGQRRQVELTQQLINALGCERHLANSGEVVL